MAITDIRDYLRMMPAVKSLPEKYIRLSYDAEADTLYVSFKKPSHATDGEITDEDVIVR